jgi:predicted glycosyltransferase involved in capsule biosynthesis
MLPSQGLVMTRACFEAIHGFDERFEGYGAEDFVFYLSLGTICGKHYN